MPPEASVYSVTACELNNPRLAGAHFPSSHWHKNSIHPVLWTEQAAQISNCFPPEDIYHAPSIQMILAQETTTFPQVTVLWKHCLILLSLAKICWKWMGSLLSPAFSPHQSGFIGMDMLSLRASLFTGMNEIMLNSRSNLLQSAFTLGHQWKECSASPCWPAVICRMEEVHGSTNIWSASISFMHAHISTLHWALQKKKKKENKHIQEHTEN